MTHEPLSSSIHDLKHSMAYQLGMGLICDLAPDELPLMDFVMDDLISASEAGEPVSASDGPAFGLGGAELLALIVIPLVVNVLSNLISTYIQTGSTSIALTEQDIKRLSAAISIKLKATDEKNLLDAVNREIVLHESAIRSNLRGLLRRVLAERFNESELHDLMFDLGEDWESLNGITKSDKARALILHMERRKAIDTLVALAATMRPDVVELKELLEDNWT